MAYPYWLCPTCGNASTSRERALDCCEPEPTKKWLCEVCRAGYEAKADAERCETEDQKAAHSGEPGISTPGNELRSAAVTLFGEDAVNKALGKLAP